MRARGGWRYGACGAVLALLAFGVHGAEAPASPAAPAPAAGAPSYRTGDRWVFVETQADGTRRWSREVIEVAAGERLKVRNGKGEVHDYDGAMNSLGHAKEEVPVVLVRYPLAVGDSWSIVRKWEKPNVAEAGTATVTAIEDVEVPAGKFRCWRVEADASRTNRLYQQRRQWTRWYCPDVKWIAKEVVTTTIFNPHNPAGNGRTVRTSELVRFVPAP